VHPLSASNDATATHAAQPAPEKPRDFQALIASPPLQVFGEFRKSKEVKAFNNLCSK
jgi:hypothetical protein